MPTHQSNNICLLESKFEGKQHPSYKGPKWARVTKSPSLASRPAHDRSQAWWEFRRDELPHQINPTNHRPKFMKAKMQYTLTRKRKADHMCFKVNARDALDGTEDIFADSASDDSFSDVDTSFAQPAEHEIMYSFDASRGPVQQVEVFGTALDQALDRFDAKETEKYIQEYDFLFDVVDESGCRTVEDDFELVDDVRS